MRRTRGPGQGIANLPGGAAVYAAAIEQHTAGAGYSPEEIHALGLRRKSPGFAAEMEAILDEIRISRAISRTSSPSCAPTRASTRKRRRN
jgi:uncharacterized protein (DUF885 family)